MKIGYLGSGELGFLMLKYIDTNHDVVFVMTNAKSEELIRYSNKEQIPVYCGNPREPIARDFYSKFNIEILISINYLFLIDKPLINLPSKIAFNIHGSKLPKYRGRTPHVWAIINGEKFTAVTAHLIDEGCDSGEIISQKIIEIGTNETGNDLLLKFQKIYPTLIKEILDTLSEGQLTLIPQDESQATYFGVREPKDGRVDWNWQKERIYNWVRAQAYPYPGAFTYLGGEKIIIDKIAYTNHGFNYDMPNGLIISRQPILVKTNNGVIEILEIRNKIIQNIKEEKFS